MIWCGINENAIIGHDFPKDGNYQTATVNRELYGELTNKYFISAVDRMIHFSAQDGATCHTTRNISILRAPSPGKLISRFGVSS